MYFLTLNCILRSLKSGSAFQGNARTVTSIVEQRKYDLYAAVCVERKAVTIKTFTDCEESYKMLLHSIELQKSLKSDTELELALQARKAAAGEMDTGLVSAIDKIDKYQEEKDNFVTAPIKTDEEHDDHSLNRSLSTRLSLIVKQNIGADEVWRLPAAKLSPGQTLRQASEKALSSCCGNNMRVHHLGHAPFGFHKYKYPHDVQEKSGMYGAKIWFMKAVYVSGGVTQDASIDYQWLNQQDMLKQLDPRYSKSLADILLHA